MTLAVVAARRLDLRIVSRRRLGRPLRTLIVGISCAGATNLLTRGRIADHGLGPCASRARDAGMAFTRAGLHDRRVLCHRSLGLRAPVLSNGARVAVTTAGLLDRWAVPRLGLSRHGFFPSENAGLVMAAAGLRARRITSRRRLSLRAPLLSNGTGIATAARLDRWAIRSFSLSRRGAFPSAAAGVAIATAGRHGLRVVPARPLRR